MSTFKFTSRQCQVEQSLNNPFSLLPFAGTPVRCKGPGDACPLSDDHPPGGASTNQPLDTFLLHYLPLVHHPQRYCCGNTFISHVLILSPATRLQEVHDWPNVETGAATPNSVAHPLHLSHLSV